jgi:hypothetical protein
MDCFVATLLTMTFILLLGDHNVMNYANGLSPENS